ncbi:MAG: carboxypeptidase-like regulatory domain-containing protein [Candidatus Eisenbacteria bacterium]
MGRLGWVTMLAALIALVFPGGCITDADHPSDSNTYGIEGQVRSETASPIGDVKIKAYMSFDEAGVSTGICSTMTDSRGRYDLSFQVSTRRVTIIPGKDSCVFRPPLTTYSDLGGSLSGVDFTGYCGVTYRIDGHVLEAGGEPVGGVALAVRDEHDLWNKTVLTDASGYYFIDDLIPDLTYVVAPTRAFYRFEPVRRTYKNLSQSFSGEDYVAVPALNRPSRAPE